MLNLINSKSDTEEEEFENIWDDEEDEGLEDDKDDSDEDW
jgi:hypothetical protein